MSVNINYNIVSIEDDLGQFIKTLNVSQYVYPSYRPPVTLITGKADFIVVRTSTEVDDKGAYGSIMSVIEIYAKDKGNLPDRTRLSAMRNAIAAVLPYSTSKYSYSYFTETPMSSDGNGYTFQIIKLITIINKL